MARPREGWGVPSGLGVRAFRSNLSFDQARAVWSTLSQRYAESASGSAVGFVEGADPASIFNTVEYPALRANPNITNVITGGH